eukprot:Skav203399  [mRNA]  locus=scaffold1743:11719:15514:+ [translate_table: standard]
MVSIRFPLALILVLVPFALKGCFDSSSSDNLTAGNLTDSENSSDDSGELDADYSGEGDSGDSDAASPSNLDGTWPWPLQKYDLGQGGWSCRPPSSRRLSASGLPRRLGSDALSYDYSFEHGDGKGVRLQYEVDVEDDVQILSLDTVDNVASIHCSPSSLQIVFKEVTSASTFGKLLAPLLEGKRLFLTAANIKECSEGPFLGRIQKFVPLLRGYDLHYSQANYHDVFRHASINFSTSLADAPSTGYQPTWEEEETQGRALFIFGNPLAKLWETTKSFAQSISSVVTIVTTVLEAIHTGDLTMPQEGGTATDYERTFLSMGCSGRIQNTASNSAASATGTVELEATAELTGKLEFSFSIKDYELHQASVAIEGNFEASITATGTGQMVYEKELHIFTLRMPNIKLIVGGLPVWLDLEAPMKAGLEAKYDGSVSVEKSLTGTLRFEYTYQPDDENPHQRSLTPSLKAESNVEMASEASITVYTKLAPTIVIYKIFSVSLALRPYHLATMDLLKAPDDTCFLKKFIGLDADLAFEAKKIAKQSFPNVYAKQWPLNPGAAECEASRRLQQRLGRGLSTTSLVGRTWSGTISRASGTGCASNANPGFESGEMELQLVEDTDTDGMVFMGVVNLSPASWGSRASIGAGQCSVTVKFVVQGITLEPQTLEPNFFADCSGLTFDDMRFDLRGGSIGETIEGDSKNWRSITSSGAIDKVPQSARAGSAR